MKKHERYGMTKDEYKEFRKMCKEYYNELCHTIVDEKTGKTAVDELNEMLVTIEKENPGFIKYWSK